MEGGAPPHPGQYPAYPGGCGQTAGPGAWNNNVPNQHLANSYSLAGHGQPSPVPPGGPQGGPQGAAVPSPLYPWMRSQFGKTLFIHCLQFERCKLWAQQYFRHRPFD